MKPITACLLILIVLLVFDGYRYRTKYDNAQSDLETIYRESDLLRQRIEDENAKFEQERTAFKERLQEAYIEREQAVSDARDSFISERLRLQDESEILRKASASYATSFTNCSRHRAETERLLLRTLDESELINKAYASCRQSILEW